MLVDLAIIPLGSGRHMSDELAEVIKIIDASGVPYRLGPSSTCLEGEWDTLMSLIQRCHNAVRDSSAHVVTLIKIEDEADKQDKLTTNVTSVEQKFGRSVGPTS